MPRLTWKREADEKGLGFIAQPPRGYILNCGDMKDLAEVSMHRVSRLEYQGWYWVCSTNRELGIEHRNTHLTPVDTKEEAQAQAEAYIRPILEAHGILKPAKV